MKELEINIVPGDMAEIVVPSGRLRCSVVCLCCERADQPMDDDGCGICDACLDLPVRAMDALDGLDYRRLSLITRNR
ncbi:hypothetical protein GOL41_29360 [Sinorhizobium medicae]|uniref:hypothetical protein n=1 Tax=Sinorhizobium medicae TaxID=110321 RepID=UPI000FDB7704|nr:hypothetical protein [Sinorhizobium medicae]MDX0654675.1 hypothetical protein [Sinorhizobium medicae]MDX1010159.1 hypothetical protein [Sinorhizobium medicae]MDX1053799.1 hypothetical protein [Sinorhizobium medicae]MDX1219473.1 hypothetical protein [Sinorhizobium medicae]MQX49225.1 hypothetical protein [Sinorhizobium medicae]